MEKRSWQDREATKPRDLKPKKLETMEIK